MKALAWFLLAMALYGCFLVFAPSVEIHRKRHEGGEVAGFLIKAGMIVILCGRVLGWW